MKRTVDILHACYRLHNFAIKLRIPTLNIIPGMPELNELNADGILVDGGWRNNHEIMNLSNVMNSGNVLKEYILNYIESNELRRPTHNN